MEKAPTLEYFTGLKGSECGQAFFRARLILAVISINSAVACPQYTGIVFRHEAGKAVVIQVGMREEHTVDYYSARA